MLRQTDRIRKLKQQRTVTEGLLQEAVEQSLTELWSDLQPTLQQYSEQRPGVLLGKHLPGEHEQRDHAPKGGTGKSTKPNVTVSAFKGELRRKDDNLNDPENLSHLKMPDKVYHITSKKNVENIRRHGLLAGQKRLSSEGQSGGIYFSTDPEDIYQHQVDLSIPEDEVYVVEISTKGKNLRLDPEFFYYEDTSKKGAREYIDSINRGEDGFALYSRGNISAKEILSIKRLGKRLMFKHLPGEHEQQAHAGEDFQTDPETGKSIRFKLDAQQRKVNAEPMRVYWGGAVNPKELKDFTGGVEQGDNPSLQAGNHWTTNSLEEAQAFAEQAEERYGRGKLARVYFIDVDPGEVYLSHEGPSRGDGMEVARNISRSRVKPFAVRMKNGEWVEHLQKAELRKAFYTNTSDLWSLFEQRLTERLREKFATAAQGILAIESAWWLGQGGILDIDPIAFATGYADSIGEKITQITQTTRRDVSNAVLHWYNTPELTYQDLVDALSPKFGEGRASVIAGNETTALHSAVMDSTMDALGVQRWRWNTMQDEIVCRAPIDGPQGLLVQGCRALHGKVFERNDRKPPEGSHIGCRCTPSPVP